MRQVCSSLLTALPEARPPSSLGLLLHCVSCPQYGHRVIHLFSVLVAWAALLVPLSPFRGRQQLWVKAWREGRRM